MSAIQNSKKAEDVKEKLTSPLKPFAETNSTTNPRLGFNAPEAGQANSLKSKAKYLEQQLKAINEEINYYKKEVEKLTNEKSMLNHNLNTKSQDAKNFLLMEVERSIEEMKKNSSIQKVEKDRLKQQIIDLKADKTALQQQVLSLQKRISEIQLQVGTDHNIHP